MRTPPFFIVPLLATLALGVMIIVTGLTQPPPYAEAPRQQGQAAYMSWELAGRTTAHGDTFSPLGLTCASDSFPLGYSVEFTNLNNGKKVVVQCTDRGPRKDLGRLADLSWGAFQQIAAPDDVRRGTLYVSGRVLPTQVPETTVKHPIR